LKPNADDRCINSTYESRLGTCDCSLKDFRNDQALWRQWFELRKVEGKGIGIFSKVRFGLNIVIGELTGPLEPPGSVFEGSRG